MLMPVILLGMIIGGTLIPKYKFRGYMYVCVAFIAFTTFFIWPDNSFDLYRHYIIVDELRKLDIFQILHLNEFYETLIRREAIQYMASYPLYGLFSWSVGITKIYQLLPVLITFIVYFCGMKRIAELEKNSGQKHFSAVLCFGLILASYNYLFIISNLRHPLVGALFSYLAYEELVLHKHTVCCWVGYMCLPLIHSIGFLFIGIRVLLFFINKYTKWIIILGLMLSNHIIPIIASYVIKYVHGIIWIALDKYLRYTIYRSNTGESHVSRKLFILYLAILSIVLLFQKDLSEKYHKYCELIICSIAFAFSMTNQSELFNRMEFVILPLFFPVLQEIISTYGGYQILSVNIKRKKARIYQVTMLCLLAIITLKFGISCKKDFVILSPYISIDNFMTTGNLEEPWNHEE